MNENFLLIVISALALCLILLLSILVVLLKRKGSAGVDTQLLKLSRELSNEQTDTIDKLKASLEVRLQAQDSRLLSLQSSLVQSQENSRKELYNLLDNMRLTLNSSLEKLRLDNSTQLDKIRSTVDEKLQETLETRLSKSFEQVIKQLENVYKGLGEMQSLARNVGDLSKIFSNVKTRGIWGEVQVNAIIDEILTKDQYVTNFSPSKYQKNVVEFAIKLPGKGAESAVYLPIDSKFPREDYERFVKANELGDVEAMRLALKGLSDRVLSEAKDISTKYLNPPLTTDFAILFLPTESLYAEVINIDGLAQILQTRYRVVLSGPSTFAALLNSLQMGFKTLAVEKRSQEVWRLFAQMEKQFKLFSSDLAMAEKSINQASNRISGVVSRSTKISERLSLMEGLTDDKEEGELISPDYLNQVKDNLLEGDVKQED